MVTVKLTLKTGTEITIEGDPVEVSDIVHRVENKETPKQKDLTKIKTKNGGSNATRKIKSSPTDLILTMAEEGFFKTPRDLTSIKEGLAQIGHIYPVQTLSSIVFKMVRRKYLRRMKEDGRWVYLR